MADMNWSVPGDWYGELLNSARQQLVRMPDGTLAPAEQRGQPTTLKDIYGGILSPATPAPRTGSSFAGGWGSSGYVMPGMNASPTQVAQAPTPMPGRPNFPAWDPFGSSSAQKDQSQLPTDLAYMTGAVPAPQNPALGAIDTLTGSGRTTMQPFPLPGFRRPPAGRDQAWVNQGPDMGALNSIGNRAPGVPMSRNRPGTPSQPSPPQGGPYIVKKGDTLWDLAQANNTTVDAIAKANGITNPNRINVGQKLNLGGNAALARALASPSQGSSSQPAPSNKALAQALAGKPEGYGSKGYSKAGQELRNAFAYAM